jgi:hypothetical protein
MQAEYQRRYQVNQLQEQLRKLLEQRHSSGRLAARTAVPALRRTNPTSGTGAPSATETGWSAQTPQE